VPHEPRVDLIALTTIGQAKMVARQSFVLPQRQNQMV